MSFHRYEEVFDLSWVFSAARAQPFTPKTLIDSEDQVLIFAQFIRAQQDMLEKKKEDKYASLASEEVDRDSDLELVIGVDCEGISRHKNLAMI